MNVNPRIKFVWLSEACLFLACLWFIVMSGYLIIHPEERIVEGVSNGVLLFLILSVLSIIALIIVRVWAELYYRSIEYSFGEKELEVKRGIVGGKRIVVPYDKVREVRVLRSGMHLIDQIFGVATLKIETGDKRFGEILIPGISDPEEVIRLMTTRAHGKISETRAESSTPAEAAQPLAGDRRVLFEILEELKAIRKSLEGKKENNKVIKEPAREFMEGLSEDDQTRIDELTSMLQKRKKK